MVISLPVKRKVLLKPGRRRVSVVRESLGAEVVPLVGGLEVAEGEIVTRDSFVKAHLLQKVIRAVSETGTGALCQCWCMGSRQHESRLGSWSCFLGSKCSGAGEIRLR